MPSKYALLPPVCWLGFYWLCALGTSRQLMGGLLSVLLCANQGGIASNLAHWDRPPGPGIWAIPVTSAPYFY
jgi:hypothetical protein